MGIWWRRFACIPWPPPGNRAMSSICCWRRHTSGWDEWQKRERIINAWRDRRIFRERNRKLSGCSRASDRCFLICEKIQPIFCGPWHFSKKLNHGGHGEHGGPPKLQRKNGRLVRSKWANWAYWRAVWGSGARHGRLAKFVNQDRRKCHTDSIEGYWKR